MERQEEKGSQWNRGSRRERMESAPPRWQEVVLPLAGCQHWREEEEGAHGSQRVGVVLI